MLREIAERVKYLQKGLGEKDPDVQPYHQTLSERAPSGRNLVLVDIPDRVGNKESSG